MNIFLISHEIIKYSVTSMEKINQMESMLLILDDMPLPMTGDRGYGPAFNISGLNQNRVNDIFSQL